MLIYLAFTIPVLIAIPVLLSTAWLYTARVSRASFSHIRGKRICLLIAHPDDEAMFFSPTLLALTSEELRNHVKILCLSTGTPISLGSSVRSEIESLAGNADNIGSTRKEELLVSASTLGLRSPSDVFVIDSPLFPDSMTTSWSPAAVAAVLSSAFTPVSLSQKPSNQVPRNRNLNDPPLATIDILLTFDSRGVSGHPNHISLFHGAHKWLSGLMADKPGWKCPVELYTLTTTNIARKYASMVDAPLTTFQMTHEATGASKERKGKGDMPNRIVLVNDLHQWNKGQKAMTRGHKSQMRWFRWGWILIGRYMVVNDLKREKIT
jgi:N-acetylglucosaminylphosphatidylinositol deacetylase